MSENKEPLAVLCADIVGWEKIEAAFNQAEADYAIRRCQKRVAQTVDSFQGRLHKLSETRALVRYDNNEAALYAAIDMQRRVCDLPPHSGVRLALRIGVCAGHSQKEASYFVTEGRNPAVDLVELAQPGDVFLSFPLREKKFFWDESIARLMPDISLVCGRRRLNVFTIRWQSVEAPIRRPENRVTTARSQGEYKLSVYYRENSLVLNRQRPIAVIGRLETCDLPVLDQRVSRVHARIEQRSGQFFLVDQSTNGTYVTFEGGKPQRLHRAELPLHASGQMNCCGNSPETQNLALRFTIEPAG